LLAAQYPRYGARRIYIAFATMSAPLLLELWRVLRGPDVTERLIALDTLYLNTIALRVRYGIQPGGAIYFEAALLIALMGFVGTVALCKYLRRGDIIE